MAAKLPDKRTQASIGNNTLYIFEFPDIDDNDTFASGLRGIIGTWANGTDDPTQGKEGVIAVSNASGGTVTFRTGEANRIVQLFALCKQ